MQGVVDQAWAVSSNRPDSSAAEILSSKLLNTRFWLSNWNWRVVGSLESHLEQVKADISSLENSEASAPLSDHELLTLRSK